MDFITIGEMVIDFLPGQEIGSYIRNAGGAPANVAIAVARNGLTAGMYCKLGDDDFGKFLLKTLRENCVTPLAPELTCEATTTMAFVSLNELNDRSFTFARKPGADMMLDKNEIREEDLKGCRILQAGSCSLSAGKAKEATEYAMKKAHELGKLVAFDINYRNLMWDDDKEACIKEVLSILKYVDFLKLSDEEIDMVGGYDNVLNMMGEYDISVVVLTLGSNGSELFYGGKSYKISGFKVDRTVDTTGAGDAFWGGFLSYIMNQETSSLSQLNDELLKCAVVYGNVSGALSVQEKGAIASLPTRERIENFLQENSMKINMNKDIWKKSCHISPSMITLDMCNLEQQCKMVEKAGFELIHVDILDGHFSPSMPLGLDTVKQLREKTNLAFEAHIMTTEPQFFVDELIEAGASQIVFHIETCDHVDGMLNYIHSKGLRAGVALKPSTPLYELEYVLDKCDAVLLMLINPGYAQIKGEAQVSYCTRKIQDLHEMIKARGLDIKVILDGRISPDNIRTYGMSGEANIFVAGSTCINKENQEESMKQLKNLENQINGK